MVKADRHIHAQVLTAPETAERFIERAIELGFDEVCLTDHMPLPISPAADRIPDGRVGDYGRRGGELAARFAGRIVVRCGIEVDYHPDWHDFIRKVLGECEFFHVIGSAHLHVGYGMDFSKMTGDEYAAASLDLSLAAARSGLVDAIGHLDYYRCSLNWPMLSGLRDRCYHPERHRERYAKVFAAMRDGGVALEINGGGVRNTGRQFPADEVLELARPMGLRTVFGSDAHRPEDVGGGYEEIRRRHPWLEMG